MSRSNYNKPFYVDIGTSIVAVRCASNHDVIIRYDYVWYPYTLESVKEICDRMNKEAEIGRPLRNCDLFDTKDKAREAFQKLRGHRVLADVSLWDDRDEIEAFFDWLFEEVEKKGSDLTNATEDAS